MHTCKKPFSKLHDAARLAVASEIEPQFDHDEVSKGQNQRDSLYRNVIDFPHFQSGSPFAAHGKIHDSTKMFQVSPHFFTTASSSFTFSWLNLIFMRRKDAN